jgi:FkbM family methyltransferase
MKRLLRTVIRCLLRTSPSYTGVNRVVQSRFVKWLTAEPEVIVTTLRTGEAIIVDISDYGGRAIYFWGDFDPRITRLCIDALKPGDVMLDIGANFGEVAIAAAGKVSPRGAVHAFEPNAKIAALLRRSAELNHFTHLVVHEVALGSADGAGVLRGEGQHHTGTGSLMTSTEAASSLAPAESGRWEERVSYGTVTIRAAGEYLRQVVQGPIAVVKIDVEGMEGPILESMESILREDRPRMICFESHHSPVLFFDRVPVRCLARLGYRFKQVVVGVARLSPKPELVDVPASGPTRIGYDFVALYEQ